MSDQKRAKRIQIQDYHLAENDEGEYCGLFLGNLSIDQSSPFAGMPGISEDLTYTLMFSQLVNERIIPISTATDWGFAYQDGRYLVSGSGDRKWIMFNGSWAPYDSEVEKRRRLPRPKKFWQFWRKD